MSDEPPAGPGDGPRILYVAAGDVGETISAAVERAAGIPVEAVDGADAIKRFDYESVDVAVVPAALPDVPLDAFLRWADVEGDAAPPIVVGDAGGATGPMIQLPADVSVEALVERIDGAVQDRRLGDELDRHERLKTAFLRLAGAVVDAVDPERVEQVAYDELVGSVAYRTVWVGRVEESGETGNDVELSRPISHRGSAREIGALVGGGDGSFLARAIDAREVTTEPDAARQRDATVATDRSSGGQVLTAVPFHDGERTRGVAVLATAAADAPDMTERSLLGRLGRTCGVALAEADGDGDGADERAAERMQGLFRVVAHELRNPLQIAALSLEAARAEGDAAAFERLEDALGTMERVVDTTVDMAIDGGVDELEEVDVHEVAVTAWRDVRQSPAELTIVEPVTVEADPDQLERLLSNLLRNAIDHAGPEVSVRIGCLDDGRGFYVEDDGPGVDPADRESIFEWGYSTHGDGLGVGLPFVKEIAEAHGWEVTVTSRNGGGARFEVTTSPDDGPPEDELTRLFGREAGGFQFRDAPVE